MTLPASGAITMGDVNVELGYSSTATISLNDAAVRTLFGIPSGAISLNDGHGKSNASFWIRTVAVNQNNYIVNQAALIALSASGQVNVLLDGGAEYWYGPPLVYANVNYLSITPVGAITSWKCIEHHSDSTISETTPRALSFQLNADNTYSAYNSSLYAPNYDCVYTFNSSFTLTNITKWPLTAAGPEWMPPGRMICHQDSSGTFYTVSDGWNMAYKGYVYYHTTSTSTTPVMTYYMGVLLTKGSGTTGSGSWISWSSTATAIYMHGAHIDDSGNVYVLLKRDSMYGDNHRDSRFVKLNSSFTVQWAINIDIALNSWGSNTSLVNITTDGSGNVYLALPARHYSTDTPGVSNGLGVIKLNSSGALQWSRWVNTAGPGYEFRPSITCDSSGNVVIAGSWRNNADKVQIFKYNSSGTLQWQRSIVVNFAPPCYFGQSSCKWLVSNVIATSSSIYLAIGLQDGAYPYPGFQSVLRLPTDGSKTGTYAMTIETLLPNGQPRTPTSTLLGVNLTYAINTCTTDAAPSWAITAGQTVYTVAGTCTRGAAVTGLGFEVSAGTNGYVYGGVLTL